MTTFNTFSHLPTNMEHILIFEWQIMKKKFNQPSVSNPLLWTGVWPQQASPGWRTLGTLCLKKDIRETLKKVQKFGYSIIRNLNMEEWNITSISVATRREVKSDKQPKNEGLRYDCDHYQCLYEARDKRWLQCHKQSKHEEVIYDCNQCYYQFTTQISLTRHK